MTYVQYARRWNWTPWQTDNHVYAWLDDWLLPIYDLIEGIIDERSRRPAQAPRRPG